MSSFVETVYNCSASCQKTGVSFFEVFDMVAEPKFCAMFSIEYRDVDDDDSQSIDMEKTSRSSNVLIFPLDCSVRPIRFVSHIP